MEVNPISMKRIYQSIVEQFINLIKNGDLKVGDKLPPERTLSEMFNVSRSSIREAFSAMEIIGLIEVRPGEGSFITDLNIGPFISTITPLLVKNENMESELLEFRKLIELEAVKLASIKSDEFGLALLEQCVYMMKEAISKNDAEMGAEADIQFHKTLFKLTGNSILMKAAECISYILESSVQFNRTKILKYENNSRVLLDQHIQIYNAIRKKDTEEAVNAMNRNLSFVQEV